MKKHPLLIDIEAVRPYEIVDGNTLYGVRPPAMQIESVLPVGGIMGITAQPGVGKSWLAMELCRAVASGTKFLDRFPAQRGGVLFVGSDSSEYDYAQQWTRLTREQSDQDPSLFEPVKFLLQSPFMFEDRDEVRRLIQTHRSYAWGPVHHDVHTGEPYRENGFHVIAFDTVAAMTRARENDNTEMSEVFRNIRGLAECTNAAIVLLHHNAKKSEFNDGEDWRGATSMRGALDSWIQLTPSRRDEYLIGVRYKKFRGIKPKDFSYRMDVNDPLRASLTSTDEPVTTGQWLVSNPLSDAIVEYLWKNNAKGDVKPTALRDKLYKKFEVGVPDSAGRTYSWDSKVKFLSAIHNRLAALTKDDAVVKTDKGYALTEEQMRKINLTKAAQTAADPTDVDDAVDAEESSRRTRIVVRKGTSGTSTAGRSKAQKSRRNSAARALKEQTPSESKPTTKNSPATSGARSSRRPSR